MGHAPPDCGGNKETGRLYEMTGNKNIQALLDQAL
jgi:hypothetical protein